MFVISQDGFNAVNVDKVMQFYVDEFSMAANFSVTAYMTDNTKICMAVYNSHDYAEKAIGNVVSVLADHGYAQFLREEDIFRMEVPFE